MIPSGYSRNVFSGHLTGGEIFAWSIWCNEAPSDQAATQNQADHFAEDFQQQAQNTGTPTGLLHSDCGYDEVTTYSYLDNSGHASHIATSSIALVGAGAGSSLPNQCAVVVTLNTGSAGRRNRGRVYLPVTALTLTNGQIPNGTVDDLATWFAGLLGALNGDLGDQTCVVLSQVAGSSKTINAVKVDSRMDIQRRRANREAINHVSTHAVSN